MLTQEQIELRKNCIGGSDLSQICGLSEYGGGAWGLYMQKTGQVPMEETESSEPMIWGSRFEKEIREEYSLRTGRTVVDDDRPFEKRIRHDFGFPMMTNCDGFITTGRRKRGVMEIKFLSVFSDAGKEAAHGEIPTVYYLQPNYYMAGCDLDWGAIAILVGNTHFFYQDIERDQGTIDAVLEMCREFWRRVELRDPPPIAGIDSAKDLLKRLYPKDSGLSVTLTGEAAEAAKRLPELKSIAKSFEAQILENENIVKAAMGDASIATCDGLDKPITWRQSSESIRFDMDRFKTKCPKLYARYQATVAGSRRFLTPAFKGE